MVIDKNKNIKPDLFISCSDKICSDLIYEYDNDENEIIEKVCYDYGADASIDKCVKKSNS